MAFFFTDRVEGPGVGSGGRGSGRVSTENPRGGSPKDKGSGGARPLSCEKKAPFR